MSEYPGYPDTYRLIDPPDGPEAIECLHCHSISYNLHDIDQRYCAKCHVFHHDIWPPARATWIQAEGYKVVAASFFEVGLVKDGRGIKTWWARDFGFKLPGLDHPLIQDAIRAQEQMEAEFGPIPPKAN